MNNEDILETFHRLIITRQPGMTPYEIIQEKHMRIKSNATSVQSELGGGAHGLLGLALSPAAYRTITGYYFAVPGNPGTLPDLTQGQTEPQISEAVRQHKEDLRAWRLYDTTGKTLKNNY